MSSNSQSPGLAGALEKAARHAATAALVATLVPLASVVFHPAPAQAGSAPVAPYVTDNVSQSGSTYTYQYELHYPANPLGEPVIGIDIPLANTADIFDINQPDGWTNNAPSTSGFEWNATDGGLPQDNALSGFSFESDFAPIEEDFTLVLQSSCAVGELNAICEPSTISDPHAPNDSAVVPEPASLTLFATGLLGLWGWRRKRAKT
jgi:hypothetical protein